MGWSLLFLAQREGKHNGQLEKGCLFHMVGVKVTERHLLPGVGGVVIVEILPFAAAEKYIVLRLAGMVSQDARLHTGEIAVADALHPQAKAVHAAGQMEEGGAQHAAKEHLTVEKAVYLLLGIRPGKITHGVVHGDEAAALPVGGIAAIGHLSHENLLHQIAVLSTAAGGKIHILLLTQ